MYVCVFVYAEANNGGISKSGFKSINYIKITEINIFCCCSCVCHTFICVASKNI